MQIDERLELLLCEINIQYTGTEITNFDIKVYRIYFICIVSLGKLPYLVNLTKCLLIIPHVITAFPMILQNQFLRYLGRIHLSQPKVPWPKWFDQTFSKWLPQKGFFGHFILGRKTWYLYLHFQGPEIYYEHRVLNSSYSQVLMTILDVFLSKIQYNIHV